MNLAKYFLLLLQLLFSISCLGQSVIINEFMAANTSGIKDFEGTTSDWIEIYNTQNTSINLTNYSLTDEPGNPQKWNFPNVEILPHEYLIVWASGKNLMTLNGELHANFKIDSDGDTLQLYSPNLVLLDESPSLKLGADISLGRMPNDYINWYYFSQPTPLSINQTIGYSSQAQPPTFSTKGGFYDTPLTITLTPSDPNDEIRYTLDGSVPTSNSNLYANPILMSENKPLRVKVFRINALPSVTTTNTYLFDNDLNLPVISLVTDQSNFFGSTGIYTNYHSGQERPVHVEYFEVDQSLGFKINMGVKTHGADGSSQKSLRLYARSEYGDKEIDYPVFENLDITKFKRLILRNGANDGTQKDRIHIKDGFVHQLYKSQNPEYSIAAYKPVHVFLNGNYFGIYNLRERQDEHYIKSHFGYERDEIDFLEYDYAEPGRMKTVCGNWNDWNSLKSFLINNDIGVDSNYQRIKEWIDIENFIDYQIFEIFIGNADWLNNNIKFWRPTATGGKWKWILWDTEYGLGTQIGHAVGYPDYDFVHFAMTHGGWGSGDNTWMLRNLMDNQEFKKQFILRFTDLLNTTFQTDYLLNKLNEKATHILPDLAKQFTKWGSSMAKWNTHYNHTTFFIENRPKHIRTHLANKFNLNPIMHSVELAVSDELAGNIKINSIFIDENTLGWQDQPYPWRGKYFEDFEIQITAISKEGYAFSHWEGINSSTDSTISISISRDTVLKAVFTPDVVEPIPEFSLLINELMSRNDNIYPDEFGEYEDWIEIYNTGKEAISLAGLYLTDDFSNPTKWQIPDSDLALTTLDGEHFITFFADKEPWQGELHLNFKLKQDGEQLGLYYKHSDNSIHLIDTITFPQLNNYQSFGRLPNGGLGWVEFDIPTPNAINHIINDMEHELIDNIGIKIFPNPTIGTLWLQPDKEIDKTYRISLTNLTGNILMEDELMGNNLQNLNLSKLAPGIYFLKLLSEGELFFVQKIIKN